VTPFSSQTYCVERGSGKMEEPYFYDEGVKRKKQGKAGLGEK